ncbi:hypothetical protein [Parasphingopyxis sp.]|uniref:hypothetical protein n=1 Tax=Parasphingopyxis sp. TaxID=1920299 RepID=UPI002610A67D|nr:hypothetical protein [Parasphingopyxis sp.]
MIDEDLEKEILRYLLRDQAMLDSENYEPSPTSKIRAHLEKSTFSEVADFSSAMGLAKLDNFLDEMANDGLLEDFLDSGLEEKTYRATDHGEFVVSFDDHATGLVVEELDFRNPSDVDFPVSGEVLDSIDWTGLGKAATPEQVNAVRASALNLKNVIIQSDVDDQTRLNALRRIDAVIALIQAPNTPWREVVQILNSQYFTAFLAVANIVQLIIGMAS